MFQKNISPQYSGVKNKTSKKPAEAGSSPVDFAALLLVSCFSPQDWKTKFSLNYTELKPKRVFLLITDIRISNQT
jgi:hypothetical protein